MYYSTIFLVLNSLKIHYGLSRKKISVYKGDTYTNHLILRSNLRYLKRIQYNCFSTSLSKLFSEERKAFSRNDGQKTVYPHAKE